MIIAVYMANGQASVLSKNDELLQNSLHTMVVIDDTGVPSYVGGCGRFPHDVVQLLSELPNDFTCEPPMLRCYNSIGSFRCAGHRSAAALSAPGLRLHVRLA